MERRETKDEVRARRQVFMDECFANRDKMDTGIERKLQPAETEEMRTDRVKLSPPLTFAEFKEFCNSAKQFLRQSGLNPESVHQKQTSTSSSATSWPATKYVGLYDDLFLWMILPVTLSHTRYYLKDEFPPLEYRQMVPLVAERAIACGQPVIYVTTPPNIPTTAIPAFATLSFICQLPMHFVGTNDRVLIKHFQEKETAFLTSSP